MIILKNKLSNNFKEEIKSIYKKNKHLLNYDSNEINFINVYHKDWNYIKNNNTLKYYIDKEINCKNIILISFIVAPSNCKNQEFHIDYNSSSVSYFIPTVELNNLNGTEYVDFYNKEDNINIIDYLNSISTKFLERETIIEYLKKFNLIYKKDYDFKYVNASSFSVIFMDNYIFHRGQNKSKYSRSMVQIMCGINKNINFPDKVDLFKPSYRSIWCEKNKYLQKWCEEIDFEEWIRKELINEQKLKKENMIYKIISLVFFTFTIILVLYFYLRYKNKRRIK